MSRAAIVGVIIHVPYQAYESLQLIWRSGTHRQNLRAQSVERLHYMTGYQSQGIAFKEGTRMVFPVMATGVTCVTSSLTCPIGTKNNDNVQNKQRHEQHCPCNTNTYASNLDREVCAARRWLVALNADDVRLKGTAEVLALLFTSSGRNSSPSFSVGNGPESGRALLDPLELLLVLGLSPPVCMYCT